MTPAAPVPFDDPDRLADAIIDKVGKTIVLALPLGLGKANHVANSLYRRAAADRSIKLRIFTALTLETPRAKLDLERRFLQPITARLFDGYPELAYAAAERNRTLPPNIEVDEFFFLAGSRLGVADAQRHYISANYTHALRYVCDRGVNVLGQLVAKRVRDAETRYSLSCNTDLSLDLLVRDRPDNFVAVAQVNSELPFMPGDADVAASAFDFVLDSPSTDFPLFAPPRESIDLTEYAAGIHAARLVADGGTLQLGIGALGDAVAQALIVRHRNHTAFREIALRLGPADSPSPRQDAPFAAGLYGCSEMFVDAFLDLYRAGVLRREVDGMLLHAGFFVGSRAFYRALRELPEAERAKLGMTAIDFVNELYGSEMDKRRARVKARFINNAMMATLLGAVVSDTLEGGQVVSGVGGQYNFVAQAFALADARSIIMLRATRDARGRVTSNIRWEYGQTTIPRHLRDIIITEYGAADLRGRTDRDVIAAMLAVTDSRFQGELLRRAKDAGKIEPGYELPPNVRDNTPERIARALEPARAAGLLAPFPFGTDFTDVEQRLIPALELLRAASPIALAQLLVRGFSSSASPALEACLERMGLARPAGLHERISALALRGALAQR